MIRVKISKLKELEDSHSGVCLSCGATRYGMTEPDAENYECEECGERKVMGPHWLLFTGRVY
jgi:DNA-directed RNA polymerase subunit RPC12/RpoP